MPSLTQILRISNKNASNAVFQHRTWGFHGLCDFHDIEIDTGS